MNIDELLKRLLPPVETPSRVEYQRGLLQLALATLNGDSAAARRVDLLVDDLRDAHDAFVRGGTAHQIGDTDSAVELLRFAADRGHPDAATKLAALLAGRYLTLLGQGRTDEANALLEEAQRRIAEAESEGELGTEDLVAQIQMARPMGVLLVQNVASQRRPHAAAKADEDVWTAAFPIFRREPAPASWFQRWRTALSPLWRREREVRRARAMTTPSSAARQRRRWGDVARGLAALAGIALLLGAVPAALIAFAGSPLPPTAPAEALPFVFWVAWAELAAALTIEAVAFIRGRGQAARAPLAWGVQRLAGRLVATAALLGAASPRRPLVWTYHQTASVTLARVSPEDSASAPVTSICLVRRRDTLLVIAERHLGDPLRWPEIYELNKGKVQPDGGSLTDPEHVVAGWLLDLPSDASGPDQKS